MAEIQWFYARDNQQHGPVPRQVLENLLRSGELHPEDLVWREGMAHWMPAKQLAELAGAFSPADFTAPTPVQPLSYQTPAATSQAERAKTAFILSLIGLVCAGFILGIIAIVMASNAMSAMKQTGNREGHGLAVAALVIGIVDVIGHIGVLGCGFIA